MRDDDTCNTERVRGAHQRAEVLRVVQVVHHEDGALLLDHVLEIDVRILTGLQRNALVIPTSGEVVQQLARDAIDHRFLLLREAGDFLDPVVITHAFGDEQVLEITPVRAERLPDRVASVDQVAADPRHRG